MVRRPVGAESVVAGHSVGVCNCGTQLQAAVGKRNEDRSDFDSGDSFFVVDTDFLRRGRRQVHDAALDIRPPVANGNHRTLAGLEVGDLRGSAQGKSLARSVIALRLHGRAVSHFSTGEYSRIERRSAATFIAGAVQRGICHDWFMHRRSRMPCYWRSGRIRLVRSRARAAGHKNTGEAQASKGLRRIDESST